VTQPNPAPVPQSTAPQAVPVEDVIADIKAKPINVNPDINAQIEQKNQNAIATDPLIAQKVPVAQNDSDTKLLQALRSNSYSAIMDSIQKNIDALKAEYNTKLTDVNNLIAGISGDINNSVNNATNFNSDSVRVQREQAIASLRKQGIQDKLLNSQNQNAPTKVFKGL
jgi:cell fate (sporulation/competence/biofilm development) regulator YmcA (YheA/YmcA/DUF963 family)